MKDLTKYIRESQALNEAIRNKDFETARTLIKEYLEKYKIYSMPTLEKVTIKGQRYAGNLVFNVKENTAAYILWSEGASMADSTSISAITFFDNAVEAIHQSNVGDAGKWNSKITVKTNGVSIAKLLPLIKYVLTKETSMDEKGIRGAVAELQILEESEQLNGMPVLEDAISDIQDAKTKAYFRWYNARKKGLSPEEIAAAEKEYKELDARLKNAKIQIQSGGTVTISADDNSETEAIENEFQKRLDPKKRFEHMENYVNMVLKGISNGLIISGAPGIGKTHRVKKLIKSTGYELGDNYQLITGRCTTPALYLSLYNYGREDDITLIDDCDDALTDTNSINILKAAIDSNDERVLSYFVSTSPEVSEEDAVMRHPELVPDKKGKYHAPNQFEYNGRIIIITNMYAGSLDTALRNRCVVCNLDFTTEETLGIVRDIMPSIMPSKIDNSSKQLAYDFLEKLADNKADMEISIRSFTTLAKIFSVCGDTDDARWMCVEQMKLQFARPGKRKRY